MPLQTASPDDAVARRILAARFGTPSGEHADSLVITAFGPMGHASLLLLEQRLGPLVGHVTGIIHPCALKREVGVGPAATLFLFGLPAGPVARVRLRQEERWFALGMAFAVRSTDPQEFAWSTEEARGKLHGNPDGIAPQLSADWTETLLSSPDVGPPPVKLDPPAARAAPITARVTSASASVKASNQEVRAGGHPSVFAIRAEGAKGRRSLARFEQRFGKLSSYTKMDGADTTLHVIPVGPECASRALAAQGELAPGLFLEPNAQLRPPVGLADRATPWLERVITARR